MALTAIDNLSLLESMRAGNMITTPSPAAKSYFGEKLSAILANPSAHSAFFQNAYLPWREAFSNPREWASYTDRVATRHTDYAATFIMLDAHGLPGSIQNNPNDPQNQLRFERFREDYRQQILQQNRDEFTPITIDNLEIARLFRDGGPDSDNVSRHITAQLTQALNADRAREFHTLMMALGRTSERAGLFHLQVPSLQPGQNPTQAQALEFAAVIRTAVLALADFTPSYSPAKISQTVPTEQVRLIIRQSTMQRLATIGYSNAYNPEYVFALPQDQIIELPDHYFDRQPGLADKEAIVVDAGTDQAYGSLVVVDTFYGWGVDTFNIKQSENRALHHASILDTNPYKTFITIGTGAGSAIINPSIVPSTITAVLYGPNGDVANNGNLVRGQEYSTRVEVLDAAGFPAGGYRVESVTGVNSPMSAAGLYGTFVVGLDETSASVSIKFTSLLDSTKSVTRTYSITGQAFAYDGSGMLLYGDSFAFAPGSGAGGSITYSLVTGETAQISADGGATWTALSASPVAVPAGATRRVRTLASNGYTYPGGEKIKTYGPYQAA